MVHYAPDSPMGKELLKWEQFPGRYGQNPGNPYVYRPFPKMVYRAQAGEHGGIHTRDCRTAHDEHELEQLQAEGYVIGQLEAVAAFEKQQREIATLAAERHFHERRMSEPAQREVAAAEAETSAHLPVIPEKPKRGRPRKAEVS